MLMIYGVTCAILEYSWRLLNQKVAVLGFFQDILGTFFKKRDGIRGLGDSEKKSVSAMSEGSRLYKVLKANKRTCKLVPKHLVTKADGTVFVFTWL